MEAEFLVRHQVINLLKRFHFPFAQLVGLHQGLHQLQRRLAGVHAGQLVRRQLVARARPLAPQARIRAAHEPEKQINNRNRN